jgi:hypothetical protein
MRILKTKKGLALLAAVAVVGVAAFGAYAYFTSTGTGTGTATVGTAANNIYVSGTTTGTLLPGGPAGTLSFAAKNFANFSQSITNIHATSVQACVGAWSAPNLGSYPVAAPTCPDSATADLADDASCGTLSSGPTNDTTKNFRVADIAVDPNADGHLAPNANRGLTTTGQILMNDTGSNQDSCKNKNLLVTFSTT